MFLDHGFCGLKHKIFFWRGTGQGFCSALADSVFEPGSYKSKSVTQPWGL